MQIGLAFPTTEIGNDPVVIRDFAQAVEGMGYRHLTIIDHVIQSPEAEAGDWRAYYTIDNPFHEPMVMLGFLAGATRTLEFATAIMILPQRPTVLVAKQFAELDVLCGGRLRAGFGVGWNALEFEALGQDFANRGPRMEEQVEVLRALWSQRTVDFDGQWHHLQDAGINPRPVQQPIPVWIGAFARVGIRRAGRIADGLFLNPRNAPDEQMAADIEICRQSAVAAGRDPHRFGLDATLHVGDRNPETLASEAQAWRAIGATHLTIRTMYSGLADVDAHLRTLQRVRDALPD
ncbi:MAG: LLM class F420-dependent oxidoreductase [Gammaproteobacteria bacterium]|nr:LLM class F420-dependent oxidoreductase [Gammaproteobacteria bacterium]